MIDSDATLKAINKALEAWNWTEAIARSDELLCWLEHGEFQPKGMSRQHAIAHVRRLRDEAFRGTLRD